MLQAQAILGLRIQETDDKLRATAKIAKSNKFEMPISDNPATQHAATISTSLKASYGNIALNIVEKTSMLSTIGLTSAASSLIRPAIKGYMGDGLTTTLSNKGTRRKSRRKPAWSSEPENQEENVNHLADPHAPHPR